MAEVSPSLIIFLNLLTAHCEAERAGSYVYTQSQEPGEGLVGPLSPALMHC